MKAGKSACTCKCEGLQTLGQRHALTADEAGVEVEEVPFKPHVTLWKMSKLPPGAQARFRAGIDRALWARHKCVVCESMASVCVLASLWP